MAERCEWCLGAEDYIDYHDNEWGRPMTDDRMMFEHLVLETFQAGLNWLMVLRKRDAFREVFYNMDIDRMARMGEDDVERLAQDPRIIRNRMKIRAAIHNANMAIKMRDEEGLGLSHYFWSWVDYQPIDHAYDGNGCLFAHTPLSDQISKDLKKRGFKFVGTTSIYAHLQAVGIVNDHIVTCPSYREVQNLGAQLEKP